jgi:hypothetical protein
MQLLNWRKNSIIILYFISYRLTEQDVDKYQDVRKAVMRRRLKDGRKERSSPLLEKHTVIPPRRQAQQEAQNVQLAPDDSADIEDGFLGFTAEERMEAENDVAATETNLDQQYANEEADEINNSASARDDPITAEEICHNISTTTVTQEREMQNANEAAEEQLQHESASTHTMHPDSDNSVSDNPIACDRIVEGLPQQQNPPQNDTEQHGLQDTSMNHNHAMEQETASAMSEGNVDSNIEDTPEEAVDVERLDGENLAMEPFLDSDFIPVRPPLTEIERAVANAAFVARKNIELRQRSMQTMAEIEALMLLDEIASENAAEADNEQERAQEQVQQIDPPLIVIDDTDDDDDDVMIIDNPPPQPAQEVAVDKPLHVPHAPPGRAAPEPTTCCCCFVNPACVMVVGCGAICMCGVCCQTLKNLKKHACPHCNRVFLNKDKEMYSQVVY